MCLAGHHAQMCGSHSTRFHAWVHFLSIDVVMMIGLLFVEFVVEIILMNLCVRELIFALQFDQNHESTLHQVITPFNTKLGLLQFEAKHVN